MSANYEIVRAELYSLERDLRRTEQKIESQNKPWYKQTSTIFSVIALIFSLGTTVVSYYKAAQQELIDARGELGRFITELSKLPMENAKLLKEYKNEPAMQRQLSGFLSTRNISLVNQASSAIDRIEENWFGKDTVHDVEYYAVASAMHSAFRFSDARKLYTLAYERARDASTAAIAIRSVASVDFMLRDENVMRQNLQSAIDTFADNSYPTEIEYNMEMSKAMTYTQWAYSELHLHECELAKEYIDESMSAVSRLQENPIRAQISAEAAQVQIDVRAKCGK